MTRQKIILLMLLYPLTTTMVASGFIALVMLILKLHPIVVAMTVLWFYFVCASAIYAISKNVLKSLKVHKLFLVLLMTVGMFAILISLAFLTSSHL